MTDARLTRLGTITAIQNDGDARLTRLAVLTAIATDEYASGTTYEEEPTDPVGVTDSVTAAKTITVEITDAVGVADVVAPVESGGTEYTEEPTDAVGVTDSVTAEKSSPVTATDPVGITDSVVAGKTITVEITDAVGVADEVTRARTVSVEITDAVGVTDSPETAQDHRQTIVETVGVEDTVETARAILVAVTEQVGITDDVDRQLDYIRTAGSVPPGTVLLLDTFAGTNGDPWSSKWKNETTFGVGAAATIQGNQGRMYTGAGPVSGSYCYAEANTGAIADQDITVDITRRDHQFTYWYLLARHDGGITPSAFDHPDPDNGYGVVYQDNAKFNICRFDGGVRTVLDYYWLTPTQDVAYTVRFQVVGYTLRFKIWDASGAEPSAWNVETVDATEAFTTGATTMILSSAGSAPTTYDFDNFQIADPVRAEAVGITDEVTVAKTITVEITETVGVADSVNRTEDNAEEVTEQVAVTDTVEYLKTSIREATDPVGITDTVQIELSKIETVDEQVGITDEVVAGKIINVEITDPVGVTDPVVRARTVNVEITDPVGVADSLEITVATSQYWKQTPIQVHPDPIDVDEDPVAYDPHEGHEAPPTW